jgi:flagellar L-ring protein precursor FlgH
MGRCPKQSRTNIKGLHHYAYARLVSTVLCLCFLPGCAMYSDTFYQQNDPDYAPVPARSLEPPPIVDGALYQPNYATSLYGDQKARRVGDILTVILQESHNASKSAETTTTKDSSASVASPVTLFNEKVNELVNNVDIERDFTGTGESDRSNSLRGQITVTVSEVLPSGVLEVRGEKWLSINGDDEYLRLSGLVRSQDINPDNTLLSTKLADARISFGGKGPVSDTNKQGIMTRLLNSEWFPL